MIRKINDEGKMKAIVSVTFDNEFVVHDIKIIEGQNGLFIAMPSRKMGEGDFRDIAHPINSEMRTRLQDAILSQYEQVKDVQDEE
ncbi:MAG: septation protein SpoVG [Anaerosolibacter sp.]|uniref:septation regulator SpoVG n=1 Tax=Anaerosolibacter sp. TaxID=1872527 RepID=UPI002632BB48|nr:septation regulator SpoVG [Anaerosolibacter sp.]MDF2548343.1 septation protein SpoVG [Anaerosolibacter sp.]